MARILVLFIFIRKTPVADHRFLTPFKKTMINDVKKIVTITTPGPF
jgi:hypothetical protein